MLRIIGELKSGIPTVLFLAGALTDPCVFDQIETVDNFQFAAIDYLRSPGPWDVDSIGKGVLEIIEKNELGPTILAGYSAGGVIAMSAAIQEPDMISGLLLSNTGAYGKLQKEKSFPQRIRTEWGTDTFVEQFLSRCFSKPLPPLLKRRLKDYISTLSQDACLQVCTSLREIDYRKDLQKITCPVVIAHGQDDRVRTIDDVRSITENILHATVFLMEGGHTVMVENKPEWQKALNYLMKEV